MTCGPTAGLDVPRGWAWLLSCALVSPRPWRGPESAVPVALPLCAWLALAQEREFWTSVKKGIPCGPGRPALEGATLGPVHVCLGELMGQRWPFCLASPLHVCRYMCVCLCMHVYRIHVQSRVYICIYVHVHTCMCVDAQIFVQAHGCTYVYMCMYTHVYRYRLVYRYMCTCTCVQGYTCMHTCKCRHRCICVHMWRYMCTGACACVYMCRNVCVCVRCPWHFLRPLLGLLCGPTTSPHYLEWEMLPASGSF